jgi:3-oxoacyl-ACP reductase-like protein
VKAAVDRAVAADTAAAVVQAAAVVAAGAVVSRTIIADRHVNLANLAGRLIAFCPYDCILTSNGNTPR